MDKQEINGATMRLAAVTSWPLQPARTRGEVSPGERGRLISLAVQEEPLNGTVLFASFGGMCHLKAVLLKFGQDVELN